MITVVVVDDHPIVRAGMRKVLDAAGDIAVVAEGAAALRRCDLWSGTVPTCCCWTSGCPISTARRWLNAYRIAMWTQRS
jgi:hypothetical protein